VGYLQTGTGKDAHDITAEEFPLLVGGLMEVLQSRRAEAGLQENEDWVLSFDNATPHTGAADMVDEGHRFPLPPNSPDMHKVVEHVHPFVCQRMDKWVQQQGNRKFTMAECKQQLRDIAQQISKHSVHRDVMSLRDTYSAIVAAGGRYPTKLLR
jgi:hypothetical protein